MSGIAVRRVIAAVIVMVALVLGALIAVRIPRTLSVFLIAALIAFGVAPLVQRLERRMPRDAAIAVVYVGLVLILVLLALVIVPVTYAQVVALVGHTSDYVAASQDAVAKLEAFSRERLGDRVALPTFGQMQTEVGARVGELFAMTLASIGTILVGTVNALLIGASALILSVFLLTRGRAVRGGLLSLLPPSRRAKTSALLVEVTSIFGHFVAGQLALCGIVGVAVYVVLLPAHFTFALLVAVVCAFFYAIPFFGMIVAQLVAAVLAIPQGSGMIVYVTVAVFIVARIADSVLVPKIMSDAVGVSPIGVMFAVFAGGELFGLWGLILAIPAAALLRVLFTYFALPWILRAQQSEPHPGEIFVETPEMVVSVQNRS